ncbi:DUF2127 domain-containing protein [Actinomadura barringtoniae]|uniref:DUF2127 domain-containing protein n=1 Tax=Actinomadura barringtoniae TaxID=1427535 RepID=A0A939P8X1_9ACTN|nr:DUF2127 domain-containing protein [Actinomadura barringtoniae]MBO2448121.1 DUF2127 domain-containing protein [Actinomadura barringtoniae]
MDWSLLTCARKGHITYAPDEPPLRHNLHVDTPVGEAWRCLRCGTYVHGEPHGSGPAEKAPLVKRGKELRDAFIMRFFAVERAIRGIVVLVAAYGVWRFAESRGSVQRIFEKEIPLLRPIADQVGWDLDHSKVVESIRHVFDLNATTLRWLAIGLLVYAAIEIIEAVGLWMLKRWGEYFAVIATSFGLPIEIYELSEKITVVRIGALLINIGLIVYIVVTKRLFGVRGGKAAHEAHLRSESLIEIEHASQQADLKHTSG